MSIEDRLCRDLESRIVVGPGKPTPWKRVGSSWRIADLRLRDLGPVWREGVEWRVAPDAPQGDSEPVPPAGA